MNGIIIFLISLPSNKYALKRRDIFSFEYSNGQNCTYKYEDYFFIFFFILYFTITACFSFGNKSYTQAQPVYLLPMPPRQRETIYSAYILICILINPPILCILFIFIFFQLLKILANRYMYVLLAAPVQPPLQQHANRLQLFFYYYYYFNRSPPPLLPPPNPVSPF